MFDFVRRAVYFNQRNGSTDRMPSIAKKKLLRKQYRKHFLSSLLKTKSPQTSRSVFEKKIEHVKKTTYELELGKSLDCFLDGNVRYTSKSVTS